MRFGGTAEQTINIACGNYADHAYLKNYLGKFSFPFFANIQSINF